MIDLYDRSIHKDAAQNIEPRLVMLPREVAAQRRKLIGIIPLNGTDWVFVNVSQLPIRIASPGSQDVLIGQRYGPNPGTYSKNNGLYLAADTEGRFFISCMRRLNVQSNLVETDGSVPLTTRGFRERVGEVPFSSFDSTVVQAALLNRVVARLAEDYLTDDSNASEYKFYSDSSGAVFAGIPPSNARILAPSR